MSAKQELDWDSGYLNFDLHPHLEDNKFRENLIKYNIKLPIGWNEDGTDDTSAFNFLKSSFRIRI